ncbi:MAG: ABC transporter permease [Paracoccaceae bacterium]
MGPGPAPAKPLRDEGIERIVSEIGSVETAAPMSRSSATVVYGNENYSTSLTATDSRYLTATDWPLTSGRSFSEAEEKAGRAVCILGETVRAELFGSSDPVGEKIRFDAVSCDVIGLLEPKGASTFGQDQDDVVMMPIRTFQRRVAGNRDVSMIYVAVRDGASTDTAKADIETLMREIRRIGPSEEDDFSVRDMKQLASMLTGINDVLTGMLSAVAAVSLLVGGIGIMNIMLVSVTERTREIGIRLAVGAQARQVLMQFLVEAVVLSLLGGVLGILLGLGLAAIASSLMAIPFAPEPSIVLMAFAFSALVGVVFGYFPARAAARLDPIEALRHQ